MAAITSKDKKEGLQLKQGESKVFSRLFTRESSAAAPSFRVYYGVASAGSVPFLWESQPGTPKNDAISTATLPPLTPPPSYYTARQQKQQAALPHSLSRHRRNRSSSSSSSSTTTAATGKNKKLSTKHYISIFSAMLPKMILHRRWSSRPAVSSGSSPSAASSCSSASSWSAFSSSASSLSLSSFRSAQSKSPAACSSMTMRSRVFAFSAADDDGSEEDRAAAPMCFSVRHESFRAFRGGRVAMTVKSALASVGGHGHAAERTAAAQKV